MEGLIALLGKLPEYLGLLSSALVGLIGFFMIIPGDFPEKQLQAVVDLIARFSKK